MTYLTQILTELREKRLWPVAAALVIALVAVPTLLAKSASPTPVAQLPQAAPSAAPSGTAVPAVSVQATQTPANLKGRSHDPFRQQKLPPAATSPSTAKQTSTTATGTSTGATTKTKSTSTTASGGTGTTGGGGTGSGSTTPGFPVTQPKPAPVGLTATQTYDVTLAVTNSSGGLDTIDPLERLSVLPSQRRPLLVELGVLKGGRRVLFAVQPGTVLSGTGTCVPGSVDCEILSLAPGQIESVSTRTSTGVVPVAQFAVTAISVAGHPSVAAADKARRAESAAGRRLLGNSTLNTLSLFQYSASLGAVVDLRNLTVGGN